MSSVPCALGNFMCVALKHGLVVLPNPETHRLDMYSLTNGSLVRSIGNQGSGEGQFWTFGGVCVSPDGDSLLVAEFGNNRIQQVWLVDGSWARFVGKDVLRFPQYVDCNSDVIVVSEEKHGISVLSWVDGSLRAQFGSRGSGPGQLLCPSGIRLLACGSEMVVADCYNHRLCVFTLSGEFVETVGNKTHHLTRPFDVLECASDGSFIVATWDSHKLVHLSRDGAEVGAYGNGEFSAPTALAALPDGGMVVREFFGSRFQIFHGLGLRKTWISACVILAARGWSADGATKRVRVQMD